MRKLISILNPIYWTTAQEVGEAVNGYTLTGGVFRRDTQVEFATGKNEEIVDFFLYRQHLMIFCVMKLNHDTHDLLFVDVNR